MKAFFLPCLALATDRAFGGWPIEMEKTDLKSHFHSQTFPVLLLNTSIQHVWYGFAWVVASWTPLLVGIWITHQNLELERLTTQHVQETGENICCLASLDSNKIKSSTFRTICIEFVRLLQIATVNTSKKENS